MLTTPVYYISHVTCHMSLVMLYMSHVQRKNLYVELFGEGSVINGAYYSSYFLSCAKHTETFLKLIKLDGVGPVVNRPSTN